MKRLFLLAALLIPSTHAQVETTTAEAVLEKMERTYAAMNSYSDTTIARFRNPDGAEGAQADCKIWYARPNFFRIDGESRRAPNAPPRREVIWSDGQRARAWSSGRAVTILERIQIAGSKMFGTYAYHIPTLLEPSYGGSQRLHQLGSPKLNGEENIDGVKCDRVRGEWRSDAYEVWVGKTDHLVRKIIANYSGYLMEELHRDIQVDQPIDKKIFHFVPEEEAVSPTPRKEE